MDTSAPKMFAPKARTALIADVTARVAAVLTPTSTERVELPTAVARLERAVEEAGGGVTGRAAVAERVAYTWFNRIVALRFMDANGYTGVGVVSPPAGQTAGQPEILSRARSGVIDADVVPAATAAKVTALLDGTRRSSDPQGEAYTTLLEAYCRKWAQTMPDMFGTGGDETELLVPSGLLADNSVRAQAILVLTEEACQDVEVIGWLYQFYISERKDEVFAGFKKNKKAGPAEIPAATQLFTPDWIVRYLVENSLGRLWMLNYPSSDLRKRMEYYIDPVDEVTEFLKIASPEEIKVVDPACGSGHMLTYAFDLLYAIYEEEGYAPSEIPSLILTHNLYGIEIDSRAEALASFALTMKARNKDRRFFVRGTKPNVTVLTPIRFTPDELDLLRPPTIGRPKWTHGTKTDDLSEPSHHEIDAFWNQFEHADTYGSLIQPDATLIEPLRHHVETLGAGFLGAAEVHERGLTALAQAEYLTGRYHVAVANPPYMGGKSMGARLAAFAKDHYPDSKSDLFAMFIERCVGLTVDHGVTAMITMQSWMFLSSFEKLRTSIQRLAPIATLSHLGPRAFDSIGGEVVSTTAFTLEQGGDHTAMGTFVRLVDGGNEAEKSSALRDAIVDPGCDWRYSASAADFAKVPGSPIAYWLSAAMRAAFEEGTPLSAVQAPRNGLQTSDNGRFLRMWWEPALGRMELPSTSETSSDRHSARWFAYNKGGEFRRWYGNQTYVVNWENDGAEIRSSLNDRYPYLKGNLGALVRATEEYFEPHISWSAIGSSEASFRSYPSGLIFDAAANALFPKSDPKRRELLAMLNSSSIAALLPAVAPTMNFVIGAIGSLPVIRVNEGAATQEIIALLVEGAQRDWDDFETSWDYAGPSWLSPSFAGSLAERVAASSSRWAQLARDQQARETENNRLVAQAYGLIDEVPIEVPLDKVSLTRNVAFRYGAGKSGDEYALLERADVGSELISYAVGCMFGRFSLDVPGLVLADQGSTLAQYREKLAEAGTAVGAFAPDEDGVLPIVDGEWFADDIVTRFTEFLRVAFGDEHLAENVRFVEDSLGVKALREYFITKAGKSRFYDDHVKRYKKRPIYWMFSSPKGSFNALVYLHRYTPSTAGTVLNEYLREYQAKLATAIAYEERVAASSSSPRDAARAVKEVERLRKIVTELDAYEHDVLYPLAARQVALDLDDGVKANYPKLGAALRKITGLEAADD